MTMNGTTTQAHTLTAIHPTTKVVTDFTRIPAGTEVYVSRVRDNGTCEIRLPGTRFTQRVYIATIQAA